jgi:hypothetical protein
MDKYIVSVGRIGYGGIDIEVEAGNENEARNIALDIAPGESFSEHHSDYEVHQVEKVKSTNIIVGGIEYKDCCALHHDD